MNIQKEITKKIKRTELEKAIRKAYKEGRKWNRLGNRFCYCIMIDTNDADIWCDCFLNENEWKRYHSSTISVLRWRDYCDGYTTADVERAYLTDAIRTLADAGWIISN